MTVSDRSVAVNAVARTLKRLLPHVDTDFYVIAAAAIENVELGVLAHIEAREVAFQECLVAVLKLPEAWQLAQQERIDHLEAERSELILKLATMRAPQEVTA